MSTSPHSVLQNAKNELARARSILVTLTSERTSYVLTRPGAGYFQYSDHWKDLRDHYLPRDYSSYSGYLAKTWREDVAPYADPCHLYDAPMNKVVCILQRDFASFADMHNNRLKPYKRLAFSTLPGTRQAVAEQRAACLAYLAAYVARYNQLKGPTYAYIKDHFYNDTCSKMKLESSSPGYSGSPGGGDYKGYPVGSTANNTAVLYYPVRPGLNVSAEEGAINSYYNSIENKIQNEVIDQLVKLHPEVKWRTKPFSSTSALDYLKEYEAVIDPMIQWRPDPWIHNLSYDDILFEEEFPIGPISKDQMASLLTIKVQWLKNIVEQVERQVQEDGSFNSIIVRALKTQLMEALWSKLRASSLSSQAIEHLPELAADLRDFMQDFASISTSSLMNPKQKQVAKLLAQAGLEGSKYTRGTLILCAPGRANAARSGHHALHLTDVLGLSPKTMVKMKPKELYKEMNSRLPRLLHALAQGYLVIGHPGALLVQTYVVTVKQYGFNVLIDDCHPDKIRNGISELVRNSRKDKMHPEALTFIENIDLAQIKQYWCNLLGMKDKIEGTPYGGAEGRKEANVFEACAIYRLSTNDFPSDVKFNSNKAIIINPAE